jgi:hypothetical protein
MRTIIKAFWVFSITTIWKQRNSEQLHSTATGGAISPMDKRRKDTVTEAVAVYQVTLPW